MTLQTSDTPKLVVLLTDSTDVAQVVGAFKARSKKIPGLPVQVEGSMNAQNELVATKVKFKGDDLEQAQAIQAAARALRRRQEFGIQLHVQNRLYLAGVDSLHQSVVVLFRLIAIGFGPDDEGLVEHRGLSAVAGDRSGVPGAGMGPRQ